MAWIAAPDFFEIAKVIAIFAVLYFVGSQTGTLEFRVADKERPLTLSEAVYFAIITQTAIGIGFGDIIPWNAGAKGLVCVQALTTLALIQNPREQTHTFTRSPTALR